MISEASDLVAVRTALQEPVSTTTPPTPSPPSVRRGGPGGRPQDLPLVDALEDIDDVQNVFANFDVPDDVMEDLDA